MSISETELLDFVSGTLLAGGEIAAGDDLLLSGRVDSLGVMTLVAFLEERTGRTIPPEDVLIENFASVTAILAYLQGAQS